MEFSKILGNLVSAGFLASMLIGSGNGVDPSAAATAAAEQFEMYSSSMNQAIRDGDMATQSYLNESWARQFEVAKLGIVSVRDHIGERMAMLNDYADAYVDAATAQQIALNKEKLNEIVTSKAYAQAKLEYQQRVGNTYNDLLSDFYIAEEELAALGYEERHAMMASIISNTIITFQKVQADQKEWFQTILGQRKSDFDKLMTTYLRLNSMNDEDRRVLLQRLEAEKNRYHQEIQLAMSKISENDAMFVKLMQIKNDAVKDMMNRADGIYLNDTNADDAELIKLVGAMNENALTTMNLERERQQQIMALQMNLLQEQMRLDHEAQLADLRAKTEAEKLSSHSDYLLKMAKMEADTASAQSDLDAVIDAKSSEQKDHFNNSLNAFTLRKSPGGADSYNDLVKQYSGTNACSRALRSSYVMSTIIIALLGIF